MGRTRAVSRELISTIQERLERNERVRRALPSSGRIHIDRQLPFLCVYRRPVDRGDRGTERLVMAEASYLVGTPKEIPAGDFRSLVRAVVRTLAGNFGAFLLLEVWAGDSPAEGDGRREEGVRAPRFRVYSEAKTGFGGTVDALRKNLERIRIRKAEAQVRIHAGDRPSPPGMPLLLTSRDARSLRCFAVGLEVSPIYRSADGEVFYPMVLRSLVRELSRAMKRTFHYFAKTHTTHTPVSYQALGRRAMVKAVWEVDRQLAEINESFDFLLQATPANVERAWLRFRRRRFEESPSFVYRPLPIDPVIMKRKLYKVPVERVEDPTLEQLFREKQTELDRQLTMLMDLGTKRFFYGGLQIYGNPDANLVRTGKEVLDSLPGRDREGSRGGRLSAQEFAELARREVGYYSRLYPQFEGKVEVRDDMYSGLLVSWGKLLIGKETRIPGGRAEALIQHEVGTHMVTHFNGRAQPFRQLSVGLAGYDELQEGLAVLAEYLVGGFSRARLRLLAGRVVAAHRLVEGATFVEVFRLLHKTHGFDQKTAFTITMRIFRGGGLTKDAVYLRGFLRLLEHLRNGGELEPLLLGKIAVRHIPLMRELQLREVLRPMPLRPRYLEDGESLARLKGLRDRHDLLALVQYPKKKRKRR
jgi:uncharacterized protein (TIGR02421 family)